VQIGRRKCAHRLSCKYLPPRSRKSGMGWFEGKKRERERERYGSRAFLIYPKCAALAPTGWLAGWLQARARVRAISISELYMRRVREYLAARSRAEREREWERGNEKERRSTCTSVCLYDRKRIKVGEGGQDGFEGETVREGGDCLSCFKR